MDAAKADYGRTKPIQQLPDRPSASTEEFAATASRNEQRPELNEWLWAFAGSQNVTDSIPEFRPVVEFTDKIQLGWTTVCPFLNAARGRYQEIRLRLDVERLTLGLIRLIL